MEFAMPFGVELATECHPLAMFDPDMPHMMDGGMNPPACDSVIARRGLGGRCDEWIGECE